MNKVEIIDDLKLILFRPSDMNNTDSIKDCINTIRKHGSKTLDYDRFTDLSRLETVNLKYPDTKQISSLILSIRSEKISVKSCLYYKKIGVEKITQLILGNLKSNLDGFLISDDINKIAEYLNVDINLLKDF